MSVTWIPSTSSRTQCSHCGKRGDICKSMSLGLCVECGSHKSQVHGSCVEFRLRQGRPVIGDSLGWGKPDSACGCTMVVVVVCVSGGREGSIAVTRYWIPEHFSPSQTVLERSEQQPNIRFPHVDSLTGIPLSRANLRPRLTCGSVRQTGCGVSDGEPLYSGVTGNERFPTAFGAMRGMCTSRVLVLLVALLAVVPFGSSAKEKQVPGCAHAPTEHSLEPYGMPKLVKQHPPSLPHYVRAGHQGASSTTEAEPQPWWAQLPAPAYHK